ACTESSAGSTARSARSRVMRRRRRLSPFRPSPSPTETHGPPQGLYFGRTAGSPPGLPGGGITGVFPVSGAGFLMAGSTSGGHRTPPLRDSLSLRLRLSEDGGAGLDSPRAKPSIGAQRWP